MIIMEFNNGRISLYDISHLRFEGDILEVDNVFRREGISCWMRHKRLTVQKNYRNI